MSSHISPSNPWVDSGPIEVERDDDATTSVRCEQFLVELQEVARSDRAQLPAQLDSFISENEGQDAVFWSKGLLRVAEAHAEKDPYNFFEAFLDQAPKSLQRLLYGTMDYFGGYTILHLSVHRGIPQLARLLSDRCLAFSKENFVPADSQDKKVLVYRTKWVLDFVHARTFRGSTALHIATKMGDAETVEQLASVYDKLDIPSDMVWSFLDKSWMTPLHYAVVLKHEVIVKRLLQCKSYAKHVNVGDWSMRTPLHVACSAKEEGPHSDERTLRVIGMLLNSPHVDVNALDCCRFTPLHWAVYVRSIDVVKMILSKARERTVRSTEEDCDGRTVLQHALSNFNPSEAFNKAEGPKQFYHDADEFGLDDSNYDEFYRRGKDVERLLLENPGVKGEVERLYRDRQVYVDAANAMLVGAALIAGVTFGGWLQPPLGDKDGSTLTINRIFWVFNSLSFFFAVASVMAGAGAVLPMADVYIGDGVKRVRDWLALTAFLLLISITCVLGSFAAAGYASGTLVQNDNCGDSLVECVRSVGREMTVTTVVGSVVCVLIGLFFIRGLYHIRPGWMQLLIVMFQQVTKSFHVAEKDAKNYHNVWAHCARSKGILSFSWQLLRGSQPTRKASIHHQYMYEALRKRAFDRAFRQLSQNDSKHGPWLRKPRSDMRSRLQTRVFTAFDQAYQNLKKECDHPNKHQQIVQCVNDECPPGFRKTPQRTPARPYLTRVDSGQDEDVDEFIEQLVIEMVTKCSGRGLLHIFLDLPTTSCRDICLRNNNLEFKLTPFPGS